MAARLNHTNRAKWVVLFAIFLAAQACVAQFWEKKPYQQWSKDETQKMLSDSPWAREVVLTSVGGSISLDASAKSGGTKATGNDRTGAQVTYQVQIRSAKPMRQAIVRAEQFGPRYQQLSAERKQAIDNKAEQFINSTSDEIAFWVTYASDVQGFNVDLLRYWQAQTLGTLTNTVWLQVSGADKFAPTLFAPGPGQSFEIRFPRPRELPPNGSVVLEFQHPPDVAGQSARRVLAEFKTKKMIAAGTALY